MKALEADGCNRVVVVALSLDRHGYARGGNVGMGVGVVVVVVHSSSSSGGGAHSQGRLLSRTRRTSIVDQSNHFRDELYQGASTIVLYEQSCG